MVEQNELRVLSTYLDNGPDVGMKFSRAVGLSDYFVERVDSQYSCDELSRRPGDRQTAVTAPRQSVENLECN